MQSSIPAVFMRGGTSRGLFFSREHLPEDRASWDGILLAAFGSPDPRQIDGVGGTTSVTSKTAIVSPSEREDCDVDYFFAQVAVDRPQVDYGPTCGNMLAGVGPYAIESGMVPAQDGETRVRIHQVNTGGLVEAVVRTPWQEGRIRRGRRDRRSARNRRAGLAEFHAGCRFAHRRAVPDRCPRGTDRRNRGHARGCRDAGHDPARCRSRQDRPRNRRRVRRGCRVLRARGTDAPGGRNADGSWRRNRQGGAEDHRRGAAAPRRRRGVAVFRAAQNARNPCDNRGHCAGVRVPRRGNGGAPASEAGGDARSRSNIRRDSFISPCLSTGRESRPPASFAPPA